MDRLRGMGTQQMTPKRQSGVGTEVEQRRDEALRRALNTPPKHHKDMKKGRSKKRQDERPTASEDGDEKRD